MLVRGKRSLQTAETSEPAFASREDVHLPSSLKLPPVTLPPEYCHGLNQEALSPESTSSMSPAAISVCRCCDNAEFASTSLISTGAAATGAAKPTQESGGLKV